MADIHEETRKHFLLPFCADRGTGVSRKKHNRWKKSKPHTFNFQLPQRLFRHSRASYFTNLYHKWSFFLICEDMWHSMFYSKTCVHVVEVLGLTFCLEDELAVLWVRISSRVFMWGEHVEILRGTETGSLVPLERVNGPLVPVCSTLSLKTHSDEYRVFNMFLEPFSHNGGHIWRIWISKFRFFLKFKLL